jgi:hypothetical protein
MHSLGGDAMNKVKQIQCRACHEWNSVEEWNEATPGFHTDIEREEDRANYFFRCPSCDERNEMDKYYACRYTAIYNIPKHQIEAKPKKSDLFANVLMARAKEQAELRDEIEQALARGDRKEFMKLTKKYKEESEKPVPLGGVECG